jgi:hypothetical protein
VLVAALVVGFVFFSYKVFIDRIDTKTYLAYIALDGKGPSGLTGPPWDGPDVVVIYRGGSSGVVCYDAFTSKELHDRLSSKNAQQVVVEYDTFRDFGKVRGYNVRSVDGIRLTTGYHIFKPEYAGSSGVMSSGLGRASGDDCW